MKAISLHQPYASAIFAGVKTKETRNFKIPTALIGQEVAIHSSKADTPELRVFWANFVLFPTYKGGVGEAFAEIGAQHYLELPRGCVLGTVRFTSCELADGWDHRTFPDRNWGDFSAGRYFWPIEVIERFEKPIPFRGMLGFFDWERAAA